MKRILASVLLCAVLLSALTVTGFAFKGEVGNMTVPKLGCDDVITIDGEIKSNEFWSNASSVVVDNDNSATAWNYRARIITTTGLTFVYGNDGLYVSAYTYDDTPVTSTGHDMAVQSDEENCKEEHGFNGDTVILAFDPMQKMTYSYDKYPDFSQKCPAWYCFTLMADGTTGVYRARMGDNSADVSDIITAVAKKNDSTHWTVEAFIPWSEIAYTLSLVTEGEYDLDPESLGESGLVHSAKFIYMNRYVYDQHDGTDYSGMFLGYPDTGTVVTICRNFTVSDKIPGTSLNGTDGNPQQVRTSGIYLNLVDNTNDDDLHIAATEPTIVDSTCIKQGHSTIYCTRCKEILSREYFDLASHDYEVTNASTGQQKCTVCSKTAGGVVNGVAYDTFGDAYNEAEPGDTVKAFASQTFDSTFDLDKAMTLDLNGKTFKSNSGPVFRVDADITFESSSGTSKVTGNGTNSAVVIKSGTTTINGGRFNGSGVYTFEVYPAASMVINAGQIRSNGDAYVDTLFKSLSLNLTVNGGAFRQWDPTAYLSDCRVISTSVDEADGFTEYAVATEHTPSEIVDEKAATCTEDGYRKVECTVCDELAVDEFLPAAGHTEGAETKQDATCTEDGWRKVECTVCGELAVDEVLPAAGHTEGEEQYIEVECTVDGATYTVCEVCGEIASYEVTAPAPGHSYKLSEKAPTCTEAGEHSFACHCGDSHTYTVPALGHSWGDWNDNGDGTRTRACGGCGETETTAIPAAITADNFTINVNNLEAAYDIQFAKGVYNSYKELKPNRIYRATANKFGATGSFAYTVSEPGVYTVLVRYNDGTPDAAYQITVEAQAAPEITVDGLNVTVKNLNDIYVIRSAPGTYTTSREVKNAEGCRNATARAINGADSFTFACPKAGTYTIAVQYNNGLIVIETITVG